VKRNSLFDPIFFVYKEEQSTTFFENAVLPYIIVERWTLFGTLCRSYDVVNWRNALQRAIRCFFKTQEIKPLGLSNAKL
jgi:hypothetical protein